MRIRQWETGSLPALRLKTLSLVQTLLWKAHSAYDEEYPEGTVGAVTQVTSTNFCESFSGRRKPEAGHNLLSLAAVIGVTAFSELVPYP